MTEMQKDTQKETDCNLNRRLIEKPIGPVSGVSEHFTECGQTHSLTLLVAVPVPEFGCVKRGAEPAPNRALSGGRFAVYSNRDQVGDGDHLHIYSGAGARTFNSIRMFRSFISFIQFKKLN